MKKNGRHQSSVAGSKYFRLGLNHEIHSICGMIVWNTKTKTKRNFKPQPITKTKTKISQHTKPTLIRTFMNMYIHLTYL